MSLFIAQRSSNFSGRRNVRRLESLNILPPCLTFNGAFIMSSAAFISLRAGVNSIVALFFLVFLLSLIVDIADCTSDLQKCSRKCVAHNCDNVGIRYGKYCGVGWSGCPGEAPCDEVDACCQIHDDCVGERGMDNVQCHKHFKKCINKVHKSGKAGFSKDCSYDVVIPTMRQGMDLAIMLSDLRDKVDL